MIRVIIVFTVDLFTYNCIKFRNLKALKSYTDDLFMLMSLPLSHMPQGTQFFFQVLSAFH